MARRSKKEVRADLDSVDGLVAQLQDIALGRETKTSERLNAFKMIADLRGLNLKNDFKNLKQKTPEELTELVEHVVLPALTKWHVRKDPDAGAVAEPVD
tara:strand:+ start:5742 stop:6038 length:297 start_codon:yes stop_codon:yes gene_type:complete